MYATQGTVTWGERVGRKEGDGNFSNAFDLLNMADGAKS